MTNVNSVKQYFWISGWLWENWGGVRGRGNEAASCPCSWSLVGATGKGRGVSATVSVERGRVWERERERQQRGINERRGGFSQHRYACLPHFQARHRCCYLWVEITAEVCSVGVCVCVFKYQSPCALPSSSQLTAVCCDLTAKDQTGAETRASGLGRVLKERWEPRGKKKRRKRSRRNSNKQEGSPSLDFLRSKLHNNLCNVVTLDLRQIREKASVCALCSCSRCWRHLWLYREQRHFKQRLDWNSFKQSHISFHFFLFCAFSWEVCFTGTKGRRKGIHTFISCVLIRFYLGGFYIFL